MEFLFPSHPLEAISSESPPSGGKPEPIESFTESLPRVTIDAPESSEQVLTRQGVLASKRKLSEHRESAYQETRGMRASPEKAELYKEIQACALEEGALKMRLAEAYIPQHGPSQFLSPRAFFQSHLFNARNRSVERERIVEFALTLSQGKPLLRYSGPELRQSDARVFLAILHMLRDVQVGTQVILQPDQVCKALFGRYDGNTRKQLRTHIQRLQKALVITDEFSVQLCLGFEYPKFGGWTVALHQHIVELFRVSPKVWLSMELRLSLSEGLTTWLYAYIASQTKLIPTKIPRLRELCGSDSGEHAFSNSLRIAMKELASKGVIESGWSLRSGEVRWMKKSAH